MTDDFINQSLVEMLDSNSENKILLTEKSTRTFSRLKDAWNCCKFLVKGHLFSEIFTRVYLLRGRQTGHHGPGHAGLCLDGRQVGGAGLDHLLQPVDPVHLGAEVLAHEVDRLLELAHSVHSQLECVGPRVRDVKRRITWSAEKVKCELMKSQPEEKFFLFSLIISLQPLHCRNYSTDMISRGKYVLVAREMTREIKV